MLKQRKYQLVGFVVQDEVLYYFKLYSLSVTYNAKNHIHESGAFSGERVRT